VVRRELRGPNGNRTEFTLERGGEGTLASYLHLVTTMLGGTAAELEVFGESSELSGGAPDSDLARATRLVAHIELDLGLGGTLATTGMTSDYEVARCLRQDRAFGRRVERTLAECLDRARGFVRERRTDLEAVAERLEMHGVWHAATGLHSLPAAPVKGAGEGQPAASRSDRRRGTPRAVPG
jgi:ATP-dependent Zn protease